jgi:molecular chaperone DnaJ
MPIGHDYYALLGVQPGVGLLELRRVWRRLAKRWHPDYAGHAATATFQHLSAAYEVLSDPAARAAYDLRHGITGNPLPNPGAAPRRKTPGVSLRRLSGPLNSLIACGVVSQVDEDTIEIFPNAEEAAAGGMITISLRVQVRCPACAGNPRLPCNSCSNTRAVDELFSAWLALPPGVTAGTVLIPSAMLPGMLRPISFRVRLRPKRSPR